ncbi:MAG: hypothetical protein HUU55_10010 [Myxococcales bacterium]|nr:hypothetical protein [Myxococcales bacterium]
MMLVFFPGVSLQVFFVIGPLILPTDLYGDMGTAGFDNGDSAPPVDELPVAEDRSMQEDDNWTFGLIPVVPTALLGGRSHPDEGGRDGFGSVMALGVVGRWEPHREGRAQLGMLASVCAAGGPFDSVLRDDIDGGSPAIYVRVGGTVRWSYPIMDDVWYFHAGLSGGLLGFALPNSQSNPWETGPDMVGGLGIYLNPLTVGFDWPIRNSAWTLGLQLDVLEFGVAFPLNGGPDGDSSAVDLQYLLLSAGKVTVHVTVRL